jgi:hypothetical protein
MVLDLYHSGKGDAVAFFPRGLVALLGGLCGYRASNASLDLVVMTCQGGYTV